MFQNGGEMSLYEKATQWSYTADSPLSAYDEQEGELVPSIITIGICVLYYKQKIRSCLKNASSAQWSANLCGGLVRQSLWRIKNRFKMLEYRGKMPLPHRLY
jgi:hypothetical protein